MLLGGPVQLSGFSQPQVSFLTTSKIQLQFPKVHVKEHTIYSIFSISLTYKKLKKDSLVRQGGLSENKIMSNYCV